MKIDRRSLLAAAVAAPAALMTGRSVPAFAAAGDAATDRAASGTRTPAQAHAEFVANAPDGMQMQGDEQINMLLYPGFTALDFVGPQFMFALMMGAKVHLVSARADLAPVMSDSGIAITPTITMADAHAHPTVLFIPGGSAGTVDAMNNKDVLNFVAQQAAAATYITSVCTGAMLLAAAGVLKGRRATTHWSVLDLLSEFGATPLNQRVVVDDYVVTGAGVTAGLDMAITLVALLRGKGYAQAAMLQSEYAPQPPFPGGTVETTPPEITRVLTDTNGSLRTGMHAVAVRLRS